MASSAEHTLSLCASTHPTMILQGRLPNTNNGSFWLGWLTTFVALLGCLLVLPVLAAGSQSSFLTAQELTWLNSQTDPIRVAPEANYPPFSFMEAGQWQGLSADVIQQLQDRLGIQFQRLPAQNLDTILAHVQQGQVEVVTSLKATPERAQYLNFTQPYLSVPTVIIVKAGFPQGQWPAAFVAKRVAVGKGYGVQADLETRFPSIRLALVPDDLEGLKQLSFGQVDAVIMDIASASFLIEREKITNLRIFDSFDFTYALSFGVRKDLPVLRDILAKTLASISESDKQAVLDKWISIRQAPSDWVWEWIRRWLFLIIGVFAVLVLIGVLFWRLQRQRWAIEQQLAQYSRSLLEASLDPLVTISAEGKITDVNTATEQVTGIDRTALIGSDFADYFTDPVFAREGYQQVFAQGFVKDYPLAIRHTSGKVTDVLYNASVYRDDQGRVLGVFAAARDVTERKQAESAIQAASVFTYAREGIMITKADGTILNVNGAFTRITGYERDDVLGKTPRVLKSQRQSEAFYVAMWTELLHKGHWYGEVWNRRKNGELFLEALTVTAVYGTDGQIEHFVALFTDVTAVREHQLELEHMAHFDALTNLPNRLLLSDRLRQGLIHTDRHGQAMAIVYLDLDGFKAINDQYGHEAGDQLLIRVAERMHQVLRESDTLARLGGDEFVAVMGGLTHGDDSLPMLYRLLEAASQPARIGELSLQVSASIGVTFYPQEQAIDADQLLRQADQAMYQAKLAGKNRFHIFDAAQDSGIRLRNESQERIRMALQAQEFVLYYQPQVNLRSGAVVGVEALIRWLHPELGLLSPGQFLPAIEDHALSVDVGEWVIHTALNQVEAWRAVGLDIPVSVNIGAHQLQRLDFVYRLREMLAAHPQVAPAYLELEILETTALDDIAQISCLIDACTQLGVSFALDDFGTGYSSLTYLKRLRVKKIKIDQSFVRDMLDAPDDLAILQGVISLASALKREVIAEGVETVAHGSMLLELGCELAQGYGIARPMPASDMPAWAQAWRPEPAWRQQPTAKTGS